MQHVWVSKVQPWCVLKICSEETLILLNHKRQNFQKTKMFNLAWCYKNILGNFWSYNSNRLLQIYVHKVHF